MAWVRRHCSALVLKTLDNVPRISVQSSETTICWKQRSSSVLCDVWWTQECDLEEWVAARWQRDVPAATHSTTTANSCANCVCLRTPSWANPSDAPSRCRLVESWRAAPLVLPCAPSTAHLRDPESRVPGSGVWGRPPRFSGSASLTTLVQSWPCCAVCSSQSGRDGCRLHSLRGAALTGICGTRLGHAPQRDPRCGRLRPPDLQGRDLRFAPFMSNTHVRSSNEDLGLVAFVSPWALVSRGKAANLACDISIFSSSRKLFVHMLFSDGSVPVGSMRTNERI